MPDQNGDDLLETGMKNSKRRRWRRAIDALSGLVTMLRKMHTVLSLVLLLCASLERLHHFMSTFAG
jgi:hypothetical protein